MLREQSLQCIVEQRVDVISEKIIFYKPNIGGENITLPCINIFRYISRLITTMYVYHNIKIQTYYTINIRFILNPRYYITCFG